MSPFPFQSAKRHSNHTQIIPLALKCHLDFLITQVRFYFTQMNTFSLFSNVSFVLSDHSNYMFFYKKNLKSYSMHLNKSFHTQGTQTTFPLTQNTFNGFK